MALLEPRGSLDNGPRFTCSDAMVSPRTSGLRHGLAVVLTFVLTLTGVGRGFAATPSPTDARYAIPGVHLLICHSGAGDDRGPADPALPSRHDCCDACALLAPRRPPHATFHFRSGFRDACPGACRRRDVDAGGRTPENSPAIPGSSGRVTPITRTALTA